jgi:hypothetical protein
MIREVKEKREDAVITDKTAFLRFFTQPVTLKMAIPNLMIGFGAAVLIPYMNVFFLDKFSIPDQN